MELLTYVGLFAAVVVTWIAVSGPGEAALVGAGTFAVGREAEIVAVLAVAFLGTMAGSVVAYWIGRAAGRRLVLGPGPLLRWRIRALARSERLAQRRSFLAAVFAPGWLVGMNEVSLRPFLAGSAVSGLAWTLAIGLGAFLVGPSLIAVFDAVGQWATLAVIGAITLVTAALLLRRRAGSH
jgi:membrane-associated protein